MGSKLADLERELFAIKKELTANKELDAWVTAKELGPRIRKSSSYIYKLVRLAKTHEAKGKNGGIPYAEPSKGTILFNWNSVNEWLHAMEKEKRRRNFED